MTETVLLATTTTGRYLVEPVPGAPLLVGFHGYAQRAENLLDDLRRIPGAAGWTLVSVQSLHRFYTNRYRDVVGSWMTSLDRDRAIEDNVAYVSRVVADLRAARGDGKLVFAGFSQGAAMAWRAAARCGPCDGLVVLGGDVPLDVVRVPPKALPPVLLGRGDRDDLYSAAMLEKDLAVLDGLGSKPEVVRFQGGHEWAPGFMEAAGRFLERVQT